MGGRGVSSRRAGQTAGDPAILRRRLRHYADLFSRPGSHGDHVEALSGDHLTRELFGLVDRARHYPADPVVSLQLGRLVQALVLVCRVEFHERTS